MFYDKDIARIY